MNWQQEHREITELFPEDVRQAHKSCVRNRIQAFESTKCGCFYCLAIFSAAQVVRWIEKSDNEQTALCPRCEIDSVLGDKSGYNINRSFLQKMHNYWF